MVYGERDLFVKSQDEGKPKTPILNVDSDVRESCPVALSQLGFALIPLEKAAKAPHERFAWKQYQTKKTTPEQVAAWANEYTDCNWATLLGRPSGLVALDVDSAAALRWVEVQGGFRPNGITPPWYETGRGWQFIFRLPANLIDVSGVNPHPGVEIRANGQYSVIPPSIHPSGKAYAWQRPPTSLEDIPYAPRWVLDALTGKANPVPVPEHRTPIQRGIIAPADRHRELARFNGGLLKLGGTKWLESSTFGKGYRNHAFFALACIYKAAGLTKRECEERLTRWRLNQTRPIYGAYPDRESEPRQAFECIWKRTYGLALNRLTAVVNQQSECMPESLAVELIRAYPDARSRSERVHRPLFESVARVLVALKDAKAFEPVLLSHTELGQLAGISPHRVAKVAGFLEEIGVKTLQREGRSSVSTYCLQTLKPSPQQLIKHFARWRGYRGLWGEFLVMMKGLWRTMRAWMKRVFNALNAVCITVNSTWRGESEDIPTSSSEPPPTRGPPLHGEPIPAV